ncbi:MAG TPA: galactose oxidase-like domain-containing protein, partial [Terriglobia bacterium]|nr:galactose oxidase-like domain-containing protein [Terriglobia bacterium]
MKAIGIHAALLYTGKVLMWYSDQPIGSGTGSVAVVWNPTTNVLTQNNVPYPLDVFCAGSIMLPSGRLMIVGGKNDTYGVASDAGIANVLEYIPYSNTWAQVTPMNYGRWYATDVELPSGDILVASGENSTATHIVTQMETYGIATNKWTVLPGTANISTHTNFYPRMILLPTGNIFEPGMIINNGMFNPTTNTWSSVPTIPSFWPRIYGGAVLLPGLEKVLSVGGRQGDDETTAATNSTSTIDFSQQNPAWVDGCGADQPPNTTCAAVAQGGPAPMNAIRENMNLVLMPDGTVLAEGGGSGGGKYSNPVYYPEDYDPVKNTWTSYNQQQVQRTYHSTALLLPDGRVLSAGSDWGAQEKTLEVFSPPYLSNGSRPSITSAPATVKYGQQFTISTPNASTITRVALIKVASCTHATRFDERFVDLTFTIGS